MLYTHYIDNYILFPKLKITLKMMKKIIDWLGYVSPVGVDKDTLGG
ncbi:hypothetical protein [Gaetbulibacter jejuensis]